VLNSTQLDVMPVPPPTQGSQVVGLVPATPTAKVAAPAPAATPGNCCARGRHGCEADNAQADDGEVSHLEAGCAEACRLGCAKPASSTPAATPPAPRKPSPPPMRAPH
jgi:hypothetical protein